MRRVLLNTFVLAVACLLPSGQMAGAAGNARFVLGYYVPYSPSSWESLQAHVDALDAVAAQWVTVDACGGLGSHDDQTLKQFASEHHVQVLPSLLTGTATLNHDLLGDPDTAARLTQNIVDYTVQEHYAGFDLDLEGVAADDRDALTAFVTQTSTALHSQRKLLTLAVPPKEHEVSAGWSAAYDYAALGAHADAVTIMAYAYRGAFSGPGSVAPYNWVDRVLAFSTEQIEPDKVLLGLAVYGYDWNTTAHSTRSLGNVQAAALADRYATPIETDPVARSATFSYENLASDDPPAIAASPAVVHDITVRTPPSCDAPPPPEPPAPTPTAVPDDTPQSHEVWIEDSASALARIELADAYSVHGVATWRLGLEDPRLWDTLRARPAS